MVFLIALIPALAVLITSFVTDSKFWTTLVAVLAACVGVFTGNPIYALLDCALVAGAYWMAMDSLRDQDRSKLNEVARQRRVAGMDVRTAGSLGEGLIDGGAEQLVLEQALVDQLIDSMQAQRLASIAAAKVAIAAAKAAKAAPLPQAVPQEITAPEAQATARHK